MKDLSKQIERLVANQRQDIRKGVCTTEEAKRMLGLKDTAFYERIREPESKLERSKIKGKFIFSSVAREFERIHGTPYREAIIN